MTRGITDKYLLLFLSAILLYTVYLCMYYNKIIIIVNIKGYLYLFIQIVLRTEEPEDEWLHKAVLILNNIYRSKPYT